MVRWNEFLQSLSTRGGAVFLLTVIFGIGTAVSMHLIHHGEASSPLAASLMSTFAGFSGALLLALKGSSDSTATVSGPSGTATASTAPTTPNTPTPEGTQATAQAPTP
jgi:hypothetical protein